MRRLFAVAASCLLTSGCHGAAGRDDGASAPAADEPAADASTAPSPAPAPAPASASLQAGVDGAVVSSADQAFVGGLRARVEADLAAGGQGGGGQYLAWQAPGIVQILVDTERKYYVHSVDDMLDRANFNRADRFDLSDGGNHVPRATQAIAQLAWEERTCSGVLEADCMFDRDASGDTDLKRLEVVGVDRTDALNHDATLGLQAVINDDRLWWALGLLSVYASNPAGHGNLLGYAREIQQAVARYRAPDGVGVCWKMVGKYALHGCYENTITNSLYVDVLMRLAAIAKLEGDGATHDRLVQEARGIADVLAFGGQTINATNGMLADGVGGAGNGDLQQYYTYNQGVLLEGLALLSRETGDDKYRTVAEMLVRSTILHHTGFADGTPNDGVFRELVADNGDNKFFKAAYFQYLASFLETVDLLHDRDFTRLVYAFLKRNADAVRAAANDEIPNDYASATTSGSNPATRAAALVLKTTYLRVRTFVSAHEAALAFGIDDDLRYW